MPSSFFETVHGGGARAAPIGEGKFGAQLLTFSNGEKAVLKVQPFSTASFRGVPKPELPKREVAAYVLDSKVLDFGVVPETILIRWHGREASAQQFVVSGLMPRDVVPGLFDRKQEHWKYRIAKFFTKVNLADMTKVVLLDLIMNNVDRHGRNILIDSVRKKVWAIDNGLSFAHYYRGYKSIFHKYLFFTKLPVPQWALEKLGRITRDDLDQLAQYLPPDAVEETYLRIQFILDHKDRLAFSRMGATTSLETGPFPTYEKWFQRQLQAPYDDMALVYAQPNR